MQRSGYELGRDWTRICTDISGFVSALEDMSEYDTIHIARNDTDVTTTVDSRGGYRAAQVCDVLASGTAVTQERIELLGLKFTRPTMRSPLTAIVNAPVDKRGIWEFFRPLTWQLWVAMLATVLLIPPAVVCMEYFLTDNNKYRYERWRWRGRRRILFMLGEGVWESVGHFLGTHHFPAQTAPARLLVAAYAFAVLVFSSTYLANLAAWTTRDRLTSVTGFNDLQGQTIGVFPAFQTIVQQTLRLKPTIISTEDGAYWADSVRDGLTKDNFFSVVFYEHALKMIAMESPEFRLIDQRAKVLDIAYPFRRTYPYDGVRVEVDRAIVAMLESGRLTTLQQKFSFSASGGDELEGPGDSVIMYSEGTTRVPFFPLAGLWIIYGATLVLAFSLASIRVVLAYRCSIKHDAHSISMRVQDYTGILRRSRPTQTVKMAAMASVLSDCKLRLGDMRRELEVVMGSDADF